MSDVPARRYTRPRRLISWWGIGIGLAFGIAAGLTYAWVLNPTVEFDTAPWQLRESDRQQYMVGVLLAWDADGDLAAAVQRLVDLRMPGDPIQAVADTACDLATTGYVETTSGLRAIRAMIRFYRLQNKTGCADTLIPAQALEPTQVIEVTVPTPTLVPPATKTPTPPPPARPTPTPISIIVPTTPPQSDYALVTVQTYCDSGLSGLIEVYVQDTGGDGVPGQRVRVRWDGGEESFFTGLKPERGSGYADFQMTADTGYLVDMPARSEPTSEPLVAVPCATNDGGRAITSYRVVFRALN